MPATRFQVLDRLAGDHELVFIFFGTFSRFECVLKRSPKFLGYDRHRNAQADWTKFAESLGGRLSEAQDHSLVEARKRLLARPPKTQKVSKDNELEWSDTEPRTDESPDEYLLRLVRTVRNNLFHGGKYPPPIGPVQDVARNRSLLEDCLVILNHCLTLSPKLEVAFADAA
jgi:hypothetical protein